MRFNKIDLSRLYIKDNDPLFSEEDTSSSNTETYEIPECSSLESNYGLSKTYLFKEASHAATLLKLKLSKIYLEFLYIHSKLDIEKILPNSDVELEWKERVKLTAYVDYDSELMMISEGYAVMKECDYELSILEGFYKISKRDLLLKFL